MKVKPSPTSPKAKKTSDIEKLYSDKSLNKFDKPIIGRVGIVGILFALFFGIIGGVSGVFGLDYYLGLNGNSFLFQQGSPR